MNGFGLGLGLGLNRRQRRAAGGAPVQPTSIYGTPMPSTPPDPFMDLMTTQDQAEIIDTSVWTLQSNNNNSLSFANGKAICNGAQTQARSISINLPAQPAGKVIGSVSRINSLSRANMSLVPINASDTDGGQKSGPLRYMNRMTVTASAAAGLSHQFLVDGTSGLGSIGEIESCHLFDQSAMEARPWWITIVVSQSQAVNPSSGYDIDLDIPAYGTLCWPGTNNASRGYAVDVPCIPNEPVAHSTIGAGVAGPTSHYMREKRKYVPAGFTPMICCTGFVGAGFAGNGTWYKNGTTPTAYNNAIARWDAMWAAAPVGSIIALVLFNQGEADIGSGQTAEWAVRAPALLDEIQSRTGWRQPKGGGTDFGPIPIVISEMGMDPATGTVQAMIDTQKKLRTGSGDALERPRCKYVPRPAVWGLEGDGVHFNQPTNRQRGIDIARAARDIWYGL